MEVVTERDGAGKRINARGCAQVCFEGVSCTSLSSGIFLRVREIYTMHWGATCRAYVPVCARVSCVWGVPAPGG